MSSEVLTAGRPAGPGGTASGAARRRRRAPWWLLPATVVTVLGAFIGYSVWVATLGVATARDAPYLSPFYSPEWFTGRVPAFPALFALIVPLTFRGTCYYYRKAYHRSFLWDPPACAVAELRRRPYRGESRFPWTLNNLHRYAMYLAVAYIVLLGYDAAQAFRLNGRWYVGVGAVLMVVNVTLLAGYTFGCHSLRHWAGGGLDCYTRSRWGQRRHLLWRLVTRLNTRHAMWAWVSMVSVGGVDVYIRMLNAGWFADPHLTG